MNKTRLFMRFLVSPIILALLIFSYGFGCLKHFVLFIRYGGEFMIYKKEDPKRMEEIYDILKNKTFE